MISIKYNAQVYEFTLLEEAMEWAKQLGEFVTIKHNNLEIAGKFGVDGISSGKFPNDEPYDWKKRRK